MKKNLILTTILMGGFLACMSFTDMEAKGKKKAVKTEEAEEATEEVAPNYTDMFNSMVGLVGQGAKVYDQANKIKEAKKKAAEKEKAKKKGGKKAKKVEVEESEEEAVAPEEEETPVVKPAAKPAKSGKKPAAVEEEGFGTKELFAEQPEEETQTAPTTKTLKNLTKTKPQQAAINKAKAKVKAKKGKRG